MYIIELMDVATKRTAFLGCQPIFSGRNKKRA
jgi:hypothetical protein